jgi:hypothetical protein
MSVLFFLMLINVTHFSVIFINIFFQYMATSSFRTVSLRIPCKPLLGKCHNQTELILSMYFPILKKKNRLMRSRCYPCVCVSVYPSLSLLGNGSVNVPLSLLGNGSVKIPLLLAGNGSVKIPLSLLGNDSVETLQL